MLPGALPLDDTVLQSFKMGRVLRGETEGRINSLDFHRTHDLLLAASDDDAISIVNTQTAEVKQRLLSKKYGVANCCFTHDPSSVIYSSNKVRWRGGGRQQEAAAGRAVAPCSRRPERAALGTHTEPTALYCTSLQGADYTLRYHSIYDNRYIRYFRGHVGKVTALCISPKTDLFLSAAEDKQVGLGSR